MPQAAYERREEPPRPTPAASPPPVAPYPVAAIAQEPQPARASALAPAVSGERREVSIRAGRLSYYVAGEGRPLLLIHSINAAASAYEVKPIFEALKATRRVFAVDLPGFGFSDRADRTYDIALYVNAIRDMLDVIEGERGAAQPVDALAISLSCEFLARAALEAPGRLRSLAFVTPTGFDKRSASYDGPPGATREVRGLHGVLTFPLWSQAFFDLLVSEKGIRYFLEKTFGSKQIDEGLAAYDYQTAHQPGAKNAPYAFVSGRLFGKDIRSVYERISRPVWMPHGTRGDFKDFSGADWVRCRPGWTVQPLPAGALPHFELTDRFLQIYRKFLEGVRDGAQGRPPV